MFLSGMGGTGKSEVIKSFEYFVKNISSSLDWVYDEKNAIAITALTGAASCEIPHGKTLHSQGCLFISDIKINQEHKSRWAKTRMVIMDEISFLSVSLLKTLNKKTRILTEIEAMYGKVHVVFVGDFFQIPPCQGVPIYQGDSMQFGALNRAVFLNKSHRFNDDPDFGKIIRKFRAGTITKEDVQKINTQYVTNDGIKLLPI